VLRAVSLINDVEGLVALVEPFLDEGEKDPILLIFTVVKDTDMAVTVEDRAGQRYALVSLACHVYPLETSLMFYCTLFYAVERAGIRRLTCIWASENLLSKNARVKLSVSSNSPFDHSYSLPHLYLCSSLQLRRPTDTRRAEQHDHG
jgi:hypothetical protein